MFVDLDELWNFGIHHFLIWHYLVFEKLASSCRFLKFKIWIVQTESYGEMTKIKFIHLDELWNFDVHHFLIWQNFDLHIH
jgi:hypothetical protein